jgi:Uma2 family endonuclease
MLAREKFPRFTPAEYLEWEEQQELRYEYLDGEVYAMTGGSVNHGRIAANLIALFIPHLRGGGCRVQTSDVKVSIQNSDDFVYPDISVTCDDRDRTATKFLNYPCLIVEVLSPSTEAYDRWRKFNLYRRSGSLQEYLLVNSSEMVIDLYRKNALGRWEIISYQAGEEVELTSINLVFSIHEAFDGITFDNDEL